MDKKNTRLPSGFYFILLRLTLQIFSYTAREMINTKETHPFYFMRLYEISADNSKRLELLLDIELEWLNEDKTTGTIRRIVSAHPKWIQLQYEYLSSQDEEKDSLADTALTMVCMSYQQGDPVLTSFGCSRDRLKQELLKVFPTSFVQIGKVSGFRVLFDMMPTPSSKSRKRSRPEGRRIEGRRVETGDVRRLSKRLYTSLNLF